MIEQLPIPMATLRAAAILVLLTVVAFWTLRRLSGGDTDPNVSVTQSSDTGSLTFLVSGTNAVALAVALIALFAWETVASTPAFALGLVAIVAVHWYFEKRERDGGIIDE